ALSEEYVGQKLHDPYFIFGDLAGLVPFNALQGGTLDQAVMRTHLARKNMNMRDFERKAERVLTQRLVQDVVSTGSYVTGPELKAAYAARYIDKKYAYVTLDLDIYRKIATNQDV